MNYTKSDILKDFDSNGGMANPYKFFLTLEDPYLNISSAKIHLFADENRWAVVFEKNGYHNRGMSIQKELHFFGNCLSKLDKAGLDGKYTCNTKYFILCSEEEIQKVCAEEFEEVSLNASTIKVRNEDLPIEYHLEMYDQLRIPWQKYDLTKKTIGIECLTRMLNFKHPEVFNATEIELYTCLPKDLPKLMTIDEWFHVDCARPIMYGDHIPLPSTVEAFQLMAEVLATHDKTAYQPTKKANSDWRNWKSGDL